MNNQKKELKCKKCGWVWSPRNPDVTPEICPHCKSRYWNVGRQREAPKSTSYRVTASQNYGQIGEKQFALHLQESIGWQPHSLSQDLGEDLLVDVYDEGVSAGLSFYCQIKSSPNLEKYRLKNGDLSYPIHTKDLRHWHEHFPPVVLVLWDITTHSGYWVPIAEVIRTLDSLSPAWKKLVVAKVRVPQANTTSSGDLKRLRNAIATQLLPSFSRGKSLTATLTFSFPKDRKGRAQEEAMRRHVQLGEGVSIEGEYIEGIKLSPWYVRKFGEPEINRAGKLVLGPKHSDKIEELRLTLLNRNRRVVQAEVFQVKAVRVGDEQITFTNEHDPTPFYFRMIYNRSGHVNVTVSLRGSTTTASDGLNAFNFFDSSHSGGFLRVEALTHPESWGALSRFELNVDEDTFPAVDPEYRALLRKMKEIEELAAVRFRLTDVGITNEEKETIHEIAEIMQFGKRRREFKRQVQTLTGPRTPNDAQKVIMALLNSWKKRELVDLKSETSETSIEVLGATIPLGRHRMHLKGFVEDESAHQLEILLDKGLHSESLKFALVNGVHEEEFLDWLDGPAMLQGVEDSTNESHI